MATRCSTKIQARQQRNCEVAAPQTSIDAVAPTLKVYCLCCLPEDGRFMICCDHCNEWYHGDCVGITSEVGQKMNDANEEYVCPSCSSNTTSVSSGSVGSHTSSVIYSCEPCVDFQWGDSDGKIFCELIRDAFEEM